jgi:hypothetical protein
MLCLLVILLWVPPEALNFSQESRRVIPGLASIQIQEPRLSRLNVHNNGRGRPFQFERGCHVVKFDMRRTSPFLIASTRCCAHRMPKKLSEETGRSSAQDALAWLRYTRGRL